MTLAMTSFFHMTAVIGPSRNASPQIISNVLNYGEVDGATFAPALIDALCLSDTGLQALRNLKYVHYAGAPLSEKSAKLLIPHVKIVPCVGCTEAGGYFTAIHDKPDAWDYISFQKNAGAVFEKQKGDLHELVLVRDPNCAMQQIFSVYPDLDRFETKELWVEHPNHKGLWKIVGRRDDYVCFTHGEGLYASVLEPEITAHPNIKNALIGGQGKSAPVLLVEPIESTDRKALIEELRPYVEKINSRCHESVQLSLERIIIASKDKPFITTSKDSVARLQTLRLYEDEIAALFH